MARYIVLAQNPHTGTFRVIGRFSTLHNAVARRDAAYNAGYHAIIDARPRKGA